mmetsp:Transcript_13669/g.30158  ORF Transcript_13669/g.30158 Transcript_13669/m.30158 type:complete len:400 (-) Transcript_13669:153-1352(-)
MKTSIVANSSANAFFSFDVYPIPSPMIIRGHDLISPTDSGRGHIDLNPYANAACTRKESFPHRDGDPTYHYSILRRPLRVGVVLGEDEESETSFNSFTGLVDLRQIMELLIVVHSTLVDFEVDYGGPVEVSWIFMPHFSKDVLCGEHENYPIHLHPSPRRPCSLLSRIFSGATIIGGSKVQSNEIPVIVPGSDETLVVMRSRCSCGRAGGGAASAYLDGFFAQKWHMDVGGVNFSYPASSRVAPGDVHVVLSLRYVELMDDTYQKLLQLWDADGVHLRVVDEEVMGEDDVFLTGGEADVVIGDALELVMYMRPRSYVFEIFQNGCEFNYYALSLAMGHVYLGISNGEPQHFSWKTNQVNKCIPTSDNGALEKTPQPPLSTETWEAIQNGIEMMRLRRIL